MTAGQMGWHRLRNGKLLSTAAGQFDVLLTVDQKIKHEQNLARLPLAVMVMASRSIKLADLLAYVPLVEEALKTLKPCAFVEITLPAP